jgi:3-methylcrotonyl-CoA carboxylase alpha subunit
VAVRFQADVDGQAMPLEVVEEAGRYRVRIGDETVEVDARASAGGVWSLLVDGVSSVAEVVPTADAWVVTVDGEQYRIEIEEQMRYLLRRRGAAAHGSGQIKAPMPGRVVLVAVAPGQAVERGDSLLVLEAMKMENEIKAPGAGTVRDVRVQAGQIVNPGDVMLVVE